MWLVVSNPSSGGGKGAKQRLEVISELDRRAALYIEIIGRDAEDAKQELAMIDMKAFQAVIAIGGDGLVNLVLQFLVDTSIPLLVIPAGTGNDIARSLNLNLKIPAENLSLALTTEPKTIDVGKVNDRYFLQILSTGFDSLVNERANSLKWVRGRFKYNLAILLVLSTFRPQEYRFRVDGVEFSSKAMLIAVANGKSYGGGMLISPQSQFDDGLLDIMILGPVSKLEFIKVFPKVYSGQHISHPAVKFLAGKNIHISATAVAYADGERIGDLPIDASVKSAALRAWSK